MFSKNYSEKANRLCGEYSPIDVVPNTSVFQLYKILTNAIAVEIVWDRVLAVTLWMRGLVFQFIQGMSDFGPQSFLRKFICQALVIEGSYDRCFNVRRHPFLRKHWNGRCR